MLPIAPLVLEFNGVRLEPLVSAHGAALADAARDGALWNLRVTSVPAPGEEDAYIASAFAMAQAGTRLPFAIRELTTDTIIGSTSYHDIVPTLDRVEIGYTWYAKSWQRSHVNTSCKMMLLTHAFETLGAAVVSFRTDNFNHASQRAIERLGAKRDGVIRHDAVRRDGTVRDTVRYSVVAGEWQEIKAHLHYQLARHAAPAQD